MAEENKPAEKKARTPRPAKPRQPVPKFEVRVGPNRMFIWNYVTDGKVLVTSKAFPTKDEAFAAIRIVKDSVPAKGSVERRVENGRTCFRLRTSSNQVLATSQAFEKPEECETAMAVMRKAPQAAVIDRTSK